MNDKGAVAQKIGFAANGIMVDEIFNNKEIRIDKRRQRLIALLTAYFNPAIQPPPKGESK